MRVRFVWPGKIKSPGIRAQLEVYAARIRALAECEIVETRTARGVPEKAADKILNLEADGIEKSLSGGYIICLLDRGKEMTSVEFARLISARERDAAGPLTFVAGGFLGLAERIVGRSDLKLSLSRMTFSHELARLVLMEQVYRALTIVRGLHYAK